MDHQEVVMETQEQLVIVSDSVQVWHGSHVEVSRGLQLPKEPSLFPHGIRQLCPSRVDQICAMSSIILSG